MKKVFLTGPVLLAMAAIAAVAAASTLTVVVEKTQVRKKPQFYAPSAATAKLGDKLEATGDKTGGWYAVADGYVHESAVTAKKFRLSDAANAIGGGGGGTSAEEVTLAGKGFNEQVEKSYKGKHADSNFGAVDAMERRKASDSDVVEFLKSGGLLSGGAR